jgi:hypothetical protein
MRLVNPELAKEVYELAKAQVQAEGARHTILNTKATSVVTAAGVSITVMFTVASTLMSSKVVLPSWLLMMFAGTGGCGVTAVVLGVIALLVKGGFAQVSEHAVFDQDALAFGDEPTGCDDLPELKEKYAFGAAVYRQHMAVHLWSVYEKEHRQLDTKSRQVFWAQLFFIVFVALISACGVTLFGVISSQNQNAREAANTRAASAEGGVAPGRQGYPPPPTPSAAASNSATQSAQAASQEVGQPPAAPASPPKQHPKK